VSKERRTELSAGERLWKTAQDSELFVIDTKDQELWFVVRRQGEDQELWFRGTTGLDCVCKDWVGETLGHRDK
jgi:hypothetical protein